MHDVILYFEKCKTFAKVKQMQEVEPMDGRQGLIGGSNLTIKKIAAYDRVYWTRAVFRHHSGVIGSLLQLEKVQGARRLKATLDTHHAIRFNGQLTVAMKIGSGG
ncbi:MAG: hypothetical protein ABI845_02660 [Polaromonas sp.]